MEDKNKIIYYKGQKYIPIRSTIYYGIKYTFAINYNNPQDVMFLSFSQRIKEVNDIELIKKILNQM